MTENAKNAPNDSLYIKNKFWKGVQHIFESRDGANSKSIGPKLVCVFRT